MKINGKSLAPPEPEVIVFPRKDGDIILFAHPIRDFSEFEKHCPPPKEIIEVKPGGKKVKSLDTSGIENYSRKRIAWMIIHSLQSPDGPLEWETVDKNDPETWENCITELEKTFTDGEANHIFENVTIACGLNDKKIEEATKAFLAGR